MTFNFSSSSVATLACLGTEAPPVGFRFQPTDRELIINFLGPKIRRQDDDRDPSIADVEVCKFEPWDLPVRSRMQSKDQVWYFFSRRQRKSKNTTRSNRKTNKGFWKPDGNPRQIIAKRTKEVIGLKRTLVFHLGQYKKGTRTKWVMHEYECTMSSGLSNKGDFVLLKLKNKSDEKDPKPYAYHQTALGELVDANSVDSSPTIDSNMGSLSTSDYLQTLSQQSSQTPKSIPRNSFTQISPSSPASNTSLCHYQNNNIIEVQLPLQISSQTPKTILQTSNIQNFYMPTFNSPLCHYQNNGIADIVISQQSTQTPKTTLQTSNSQIIDSLPAINSPLCHCQDNGIADITISQLSTQTPTDENQNLDNQDGISSASVKVEWRPSMAVSSTDYGTQTQYENSDILDPDGLLASDLESKCEEEPEGNSEFFDQLCAFMDSMSEQDYMVNSPPWMPTHSDESPSSLLFPPSATQPSGPCLCL